MSVKPAVRRRKRKRVFSAVIVFVVVLLMGRLISPSEVFAWDALFLRIYDWETGAVYAEAPAKVGSALFFGWIHSLEKIPWNEYYHVGEKGRLILDAITFPAFGAGIPENKGKVCYVENGLIHMEKIDQVFEELVWLNSRTATGKISLDGVPVTRGSELPHHVRLRLVIEKSEGKM